MGPPIKRGQCILYKELDASHRLLVECLVEQLKGF